MLKVNNVGNSNSDKTFTYNLTITSISNTIGTIGGGLNLVINGKGFSSMTTVSICAESCRLITSSVDSLTCIVNDKIKFVFLKYTFKFNLKIRSHPVLIPILIQFVL